MQKHWTGPRASRREKTPRDFSVINPTLHASTCCFGRGFFKFHLVCCSLRTQPSISMAYGQELQVFCSRDRHVRSSNDREAGYLKDVTILFIMITHPDRVSNETSSNIDLTSLTLPRTLLCVASPFAEFRSHSSTLSRPVSRCFHHSKSID